MSLDLTPKPRSQLTIASASPSRAPTAASPARSTRSGGAARSVQARCFIATNDDHTGTVSSVSCWRSAKRRSMMRRSTLTHRSYSAPWATAWRRPWVPSRVTAVPISGESRSVRRPGYSRRTCRDNSSAKTANASRACFAHRSMSSELVDHRGRCEPAQYRRTRLLSRRPRCGQCRRASARSGGPS